MSYEGTTVRNYGTTGEALREGEMSAFVIVQIEIEDAGTYERYKALAPPSIAEFGGRYIARGGRTETLEGNWQPARLVILEFPDLDAARAWWHSEVYAEAKALRHQSAHSQMIVVEGCQ